MMEGRSQGRMRRNPQPREVGDALKISAANAESACTEADCSFASARRCSWVAPRLPTAPQRASRLLPRWCRLRYDPQPARATFPHVRVVGLGVVAVVPGGRLRRL